MFFFTVQVDQENRMTIFSGEMTDQGLIMIVLEMWLFSTPPIAQISII